MLKGNEVLLNNISNSIKSKLDSSATVKGNVIIEENVTIENSEITGPVIIACGSTIKNCKIGPYVSLGKNICLSNVRLENSIIRENTKISNATYQISNSVIGKNVELTFTDGSKNLNGNNKLKYIIGDDTKCISL